MDVEQNQNVYIYEVLMKQRNGHAIELLNKHSTFEIKEWKLESK